MTTVTPPAGWYDDPDITGQLRWWDGAGWTERRIAPPGPPSGAVRPVGVRSTAVPPPAAPPAGRPPTPAPGPGAPSQVVASPWERVVAVGLDGVVSISVLVALPLVVRAVAGLSGLQTGVTVGPLTLAAGALLGVAQVAGVGRLGQTYGKHLVGIAVVSATGRTIGSSRALGRGIVQVIGLHALGLGVLWILWDPRRQGWHDKAVASIVVRTQPARRLGPVGWVRAIVGAR